MANWLNVQKSSLSNSYLLINRHKLGDKHEQDNYAEQAINHDQ